MNREQDRRNFLKAGAAIAAATTIAKSAPGQDSAQNSATDDQDAEKLVLGIMGVNGRGKAIARGMMQQPNVEIGYICDVDSRAAELTAMLVSKDQGKTPKIVTDFRDLLKDKDVDVLVLSLIHISEPARPY